MQICPFWVISVYITNLERRRIPPAGSPISTSPVSRINAPLFSCLPIPVPPCAAPGCCPAPTQRPGAERCRGDTQEQDAANGLGSVHTRCESRAACCELPASSNGLVRLLIDGSGLGNCQKLFQSPSGSEAAPHGDGGSADRGIWAASQPAAEGMVPGLLRGTLQASALGPSSSRLWILAAGCPTGPCGSCPWSSPRGKGAGMRRRGW